MGGYWSKQDTELETIWKDISEPMNNYKIFSNIYNLFLYDQSTCYLITHKQTLDQVIFIRSVPNYLIKFIGQIEIVQLHPENNFINQMITDLKDNSFQIISGNLKVDIYKYISTYKIE